MTCRRGLSLLLIASAIPLAFAGCGGSPARPLAKAPELETKDTRCSVRRSWDKPLIVEWPSADRLELEARAKEGPVVVHYSGCEMRMLSSCRVDGRYVFTPTTPKSDTIAIRDTDELYATIPIGAASFEGKLEKYGQLNVAMTMVGRLATTEPDVGRGQLSGSCKDATHVIAGLTVGAFEFYAGAEASVGAGANVVVAEAGGESSASHHTFTRDGSREACRTATEKDTAPPASCGAVLRVEVVPISANAKWRPLSQQAKSAPAEEPPKQAACPVGTRREGEKCVSRFTDEKKACSFVGDCGQACDAGNARACVTLGKLYDSGKGGTRDLSRAAEAYQLGCDQGDGEGCLRVGQAYLYGQGVLEDGPRGLASIELGCKKEHAESCAELGNLLVEGRKVKGDVKKGVAHQTHACELGLAFACTRVGVLYQEGRAIAGDIKKATQFLERACKLDSRYSCAAINRLKGKL
jgi:TPR repeat protein